MKKQILSLSLLLSAPLVAMEVRQVSEEEMARDFNSRPPIAPAQVASEDIERIDTAFEQLKRLNEAEEGKKLAQAAEEGALTILKESMKDAKEVGDNVVLMQLAADLKKLDASLAARVEANKAKEVVSDNDSYLSETERGLTKGERSSYRLAKKTDKVTALLIQASPKITEWFANLLMKPNDLDSLRNFANELNQQIDGMEVWMQKVDHKRYLDSAAFHRLKSTMEFLIKKTRSTRDNNDEAWDQLEGNFGHPGMQFLLSIESLETMIEAYKKNRLL